MVSQIAWAPIMPVMNDKVPVKNVAELKAYLAANNGKVSYGSRGIG
jgi:tripartite-type tricarboxylate transporter receptor subunit TctC